MILGCLCEFRGFSTKVCEKGTFTKVNLEDINGESASFNCDSSLIKTLSTLSKGDKVNVEIDYNITFKSLKLVSINKGVK